MKFVILCMLPGNDASADRCSPKPSNFITGSRASEPNPWKLAFLSVRSVGGKMPTILHHANRQIWKLDYPFLVHLSPILLHNISSLSSNSHWSIFWICGCIDFGTSITDGSFLEHTRSSINKRQSCWKVHLRSQRITGERFKWQSESVSSLEEKTCLQATEDTWTGRTSSVIFQRIR